ncbi:hypothetical protein NQZ68_039155 [Dissostichus eleginoides]|nr:hypothetical protein NQZ68_039155 [Dissostichus eleginoides]
MILRMSVALCTWDDLLSFSPKSGCEERMRSTLVLRFPGKAERFSRGQNIDNTKKGGSWRESRPHRPLKSKINNPVQMIS